MKVLRSRSLAFQHDALGEEAEKAAKKAAKKQLNIGYMDDMACGMEHCPWCTRNPPCRLIMMGPFWCCPHESCWTSDRCQRIVPLSAAAPCHGQAGQGERVTGQQTQVAQLPPLGPERRLYQDMQDLKLRELLRQQRSTGRLRSFARHRGLQVQIQQLQVRLARLQFREVPAARRLVQRARRAACICRIQNWWRDYLRLQAPRWWSLGPSVAAFVAIICIQRWWRAERVLARTGGPGASQSGRSGGST